MSITLKATNVMKLFTALLILGSLIPTVSATKTQYTIVMKGEWSSDNTVKSLPVKLAAKVSPDAEGRLKGTAVFTIMFVLPDGTKITQRKFGTISLADDYNMFTEELVVTFESITSPEKIVFRFAKEEGSDLWVSNTDFSIYGYAGKLYQEFKLKF